MDFENQQHNILVLLRKCPFKTLNSSKIYVTNKKNKEEIKTLTKWIAISFHLQNLKWANKL